MFAIVEIGGKQYKVQEKDVLNVEKIDAAVDSTVSEKKVLLVSDKEIKIGTPYISGASVELKILKTAKADKVYTFKMKAKKRYKKTKNSRQFYSEVEVVKIKA